MPATSNFRGKKLLQAITSLMDSLESRYRSVFLETIENITNSPDIAEIIRDIRLGNITTIDNATLARIQGVQLNTYDLTVASRQAMASGGKITAKTVGLEGKFNLQNPRAINAARTLSDELVGTLSKTVTKNLTDIITDAVSGTDSLSETVRRIKDEIGLTTQHSAAVKNYRKNLIQTGMDKAKALSQSEKYAKRLLKYRAETIARTEVAIAVNKGQAEFWKQMKDDGSIPPTAMRIWIAEMDSKTCEICSPLNGELAPIDGSWSTGAGFFDIPHAHPRCRCTSGLVFPSKITKDDPTGYEQWVISKGDFVGHPFRGNQWTRNNGRSAPKDPTKGSQGGGSAGVDINARLEYLDSTQVIIDRIRKVARQLEEDQNWLEHLTGAEKTKKQRSVKQSEKELEELGAKRLSNNGDKITFDGDHSVYEVMGGTIKAGDTAEVIKPAWSWRDKGGPEGFFRIDPDKPAVTVVRGIIVPIVSKGDFVGHPFRGNQWTKVGGTGVGSKNEASASSIDWNVLYDNDVPGELESYLGSNALQSLENWIYNAKYPTQWLKEVAGKDYEYEEHYQTLQGWLKEAKFPDTVTVIRQGTPDSRGDIRSGSAMEGWTGGAIDAQHHYGSDRKIYVSKVPRKNIIGFGQLEEGELFYKTEGVTVTELKR